MIVLPPGNNVTRSEPAGAAMDTCHVTRHDAGRLAAQGPPRLTVRTSEAGCVHRLSDMRALIVYVNLSRACFQRTSKPGFRPPGEF